jgi:hypothetical protein
MQNFLPLT